MASLETAPVEKDALFEALSTNVAVDNTEDRTAETEVEALGQDEDLSVDGEEEGFAEQEYENEEDQHLSNDPAFQRFLEASDDEEDAALDDSLGLDETLPQTLRIPKRPGEILSTHRSHPEVKRVLTDQQRLKELERLQHDHVAKQAAAEDAKDSLEIEEQKLRALRKQAAQGQPGDSSRVTYQKQEVQQSLARLTDAEKARDLAALALHKHKLSDETARVGRQAGKDVQHHAAVAQRHKADEVNRAKRVINAERMAREASREREMFWNEEMQRREDAANYHQALGKRRLKASQAAIKEKQRQAEELREIKFQHDAQKVLQLKESTDKINRQINGQNEARRKKAQKVQEEREQRKRDMLNEGKNPYEEWRKEEIVADKEKQEQLLKQKTIIRNEKLVEQLLSEDQRYKESRKVLAAKRLEDDKFQKEMGNYAREKRVAAYIRKVTIGNVDVLDPTGTAIRIDASKVTVQKTHAFGLGRVRPEEITKVHRDLKKAKRQMDTWRPPRPQEDADFDDMPIGDDAPGPEDESDEPSDGRLAIPKLSILEEKYLAAARERQKANICTIQRCWGKEFKGDAFIAKPSVITFYDFEVGKKYRQVIEVTNVSLTFNQFKLLPLENKYKDFFDIVFVPPGRMSAGVTRYITIWFTPKVYEDIKTTFPILAKTGHIEFPLICKTKKTILSITPQDSNGCAVIDFGKVLDGEQDTQVLQIKNSGALSTEFKLDALEKDNPLLDMMSFKPDRGEFAALATSKIAFTFKPTALGAFACMLKLSVDNGAQGDAKLAEEWTVCARGHCIDVPIYVEKEEYDVKTILYDHTFRENIVFHNRQSVAMKITVVEPQPIDGELQLNPSVAYIQGHQSQAVQIKFSPKEDFLQKNPQYRDKTKRPDVEGAFRIPFKIVGADQKLPVHTEFVGILTTDFISFQPSILKFGSCFIGSAATFTMTIVNESCLPQRYCFVRLPSFLKVEDYPGDVIEEEEANSATWSCGTAVLDDGGYGALGVLLPKEHRRVCVSYCPEAATEMDYAMTIKAITGKLCTRTFTVQCKGQGRQPPIIFSTTQLQMASIPSDATCKDSIEITNKSGVSYAINLLVPPSESSALYVSPVACTIAPDETTRLQVEFKPKEDYVKFLEQPEPPAVDVPEGEDPPPPAENTESEDPPPPKVTPEEFKQERLNEIRMHGGRRWDVTQSDTGRSIHASWKIPICVRVKPDDVDLQSSMPVVTMYACVRTCVLPSVLRADPVIADFGEITALQREVMDVTLQNMFPGEAQELHIEPLPENACFTVLNAPRTIGSKPFKLRIEFKPEFVQIYGSVLKLYTQNTRVQIPLKGKGVRPVLKINPESETETEKFGVLQLGAVMYNKACADYTEKTLEIENDSPYPLCYTLETLIAAETHHVGPPPFTITPSSGVVPGHGSKSLKVTFRPHRPLAVFREKLLVNVPNQKKPTHVYLYGHCFTQQTYCMPYLEFEPFGGTDVKTGSAFLDSIAVGSGAVVGADGHFTYKTAQQSEFSLVFEHGETVKYLLAGACHPAGTPTAPQNSPATSLDFQIQQSEFSSCFTVEAPGAAAGAAAKVPVKPGDASIQVAFRYKPPETSSLTVGNMELDLLSGIGKWITCKVKGSLLDGPAAQEIWVELRAYLQQI